MGYNALNKKYENELKEKSVLLQQLQLSIKQNETGKNSSNTLNLVQQSEMDEYKFLKSTNIQYEQQINEYKQSSAKLQLKFQQQLSEFNQELSSLKDENKKLKDKNQELERKVIKLSQTVKDENNMNTLQNKKESSSENDEENKSSTSTVKS